MIFIILENIPHLHGFCKFEKIKDQLIQCRAINKLPDKSETIISFAFPYKVEVRDHNISRYAIVADYHNIIGNILKNIADQLKNKFVGYQFSYFVDNSPIPEVKAAALSGIGVIGKNGLLITKKYGSWVFLGEIVTDMHINFPEHNIKSCINCGRCINICPTQSLGKTTFCKESCLSNISQKKGQLSDKEQTFLKSSSIIWGCDICQESCPMNDNSNYTYITEFLESCVPLITKENYKSLTDRAFHWRPAEVIKRNLDNI